MTTVSEVSVVVVETGPPGRDGVPQCSVQASEALAAGDWVNLHNVSGSPRARRADATAAGREADGYVRAAAALGDVVTVYLGGTNDLVTGQTPGNVYLQTTPGQGGPTPPAALGNVVQRIGSAVSATAVIFTRGAAIRRGS